MSVHISPELAQWLRARIAEGHDKPAIVASLRTHGYDRNLAERIAAQAFGKPVALVEAAVAAPSPRPIFLSAEPSNAADPLTWFEPAHPIAGDRHRNRIPADHGDIRVLARSERPYVVTLGNVLTAAECAELIDYCRPRLNRALVVNRDGGEGEIDPRRTSEEAILTLGESPLVARIEARIRELTGVPVSHGEGLMVMRYGIGAEYQPHFDFFDPAIPGEKRHHDLGQRMASLVIYLNDVPAGGETVFPDGDIEVVPQTGNAAYFAYTDAQGRCDRLSFHGGAPVLSGEKWIATKWLRDRPYQS